MTTTPDAPSSRQHREWLTKMGGRVLPRKILGGRERDLSRLGFILGPEIDELFREAQLPEGWEMRPSDDPVWSLIHDGDGHERVAVFFKPDAEEQVAHMMLLADGGALA